MENLEKVSLGDAVRSSLHNNRVTRERALDKYFKPTNIDLSDNTNSDYNYIAPTQEQLDKLEKANQLRIKKEIMVLLVSAAIVLFSIIVVFGFLN
ncbi:MAG: hypothetical protein R2728_14730 [Chitinophagales bacterium]